MHIIESQQFDPDFISTLFRLVDRVQELRATESGRASLSRTLPGKVLVNFFYEESTRTRVSFNMAAQLLGMLVVETTNAGMFSSVAKGECLEHTMRVLFGYQPDVVVLRHMQEHAVQTAVDISDRCGYNVPLINAGDGPGQHPTQALTDLYTIEKSCPELQGLRVVVVGDLRFGRTTHSLVYLLSQYQGTRFVFVSPPELSMKQGVLDHLNEQGVAWRATDNLADAIKDPVDVLYMTRTQWERLFKDHSGVVGTLYRWVKRRELDRQSSKCRLTVELARSLPAYTKVMHPMPILSEIARRVDDLPQATYFVQAAHGLPVRMALLLHVLGGAHLLA